MSRRNCTSRQQGRVIAALAVFVLAGCYQDMTNQGKYEPLEASAFPGFEDGRSSRLLVAGTIPRGALNDGGPFHTGRGDDGQPATEIPVEVDRAFLERGRQKFDIYCSACHDRTGFGDGIVVQAGFPRPPSLHIERLRDAPPGQIFNVITGGFGRMPPYADQLAPRDRWAVVAYLQALQLSQHADVSELPAELREKLPE